MRPVESRAALQQAGGVQHVGHGAGAVVAAVAPAAVAAAPLVGLARDAVGGGDGRDDLRRGAGGRERGAAVGRHRWRSAAGAAGGGSDGEAAGGVGARRAAVGGAEQQRRRSAASATVRPRTGRVDFTVSGLRLRFPVRFRGELTGSRWKDLRYTGLEGRRFAPTTWVPRPPGLGARAVQRCTTRFNRARGAEVAVLTPSSESSASGARDLSRRVGGVLVERLLAQQRLGQRVELGAVLGRAAACTSA